MNGVVKIVAVGPLYVQPCKSVYQVIYASGKVSDPINFLHT